MTFFIFLFFYFRRIIKAHQTLLPKIQSNFKSKKFGESPTRKKHFKKQKSVKVSDRFKNRNHKSPQTSGKFKKNFSNVMQSHDRMNLHSKMESNQPPESLQNQKKISQSVNRYGTLTSQKSNRDYLIDLTDSKKIIKPTIPIHNEIERHDPRPQNYEEEDTQGRFSKTSLNKIDGNDGKYDNIFDSKPEMLEKIDFQKVGGKTRFTVMPQTGLQPHFQENPMAKYTTNQPGDSQRKRVNTLFPQGSYNNGKKGRSLTIRSPKSELDQ